MNILFLLLPLVFLFMGLPIFLILLTTGLIVLLLSPGVPPDVVQTILFGSLDNFPLLAIPFFIFAGEIMGQSGIARRLVAWVISLIGGVRGSLAVATIASSELFGAMAGSAVGSVAAVGRLLHPALHDAGYSTRFSGSLIAASGAVAVIIPPSIALIIYSVTAQQSLTELFLAGLIPAFLIVVMDSAYVLVVAKIEMIPLTSKLRWSNVWEATKDASWALGTIAVIFGGIYGGVFTPTEAAGVAVVYSAFISVVIYRDINLRDLLRIAGSAASLTTQILLIVACAGVYSWLLTTSGIPQNVTHWIESLHAGTVGTLLLMNLVLLAVGSFLEPPAAILVLVPLFLPIAHELGINPIHFGIMFAVNLSIGMYTPPFGLNIFAAHLLLRTPLSTLYRGVLPFLLINLVALLLITFIPEISLVLVPH